MNTQATLQQLQSLKLEGMARTYEATLALAAHQQPEAHELVAQLAQAEVESKANKRTQMYLRLSKLRYAASLEQVKCSAERNLTKEQLSTLVDCSWMDRAENLLITGATGCGKSYLACAIGQHACMMGYKTLYMNMNRFIEKITMSKLEGSFIKTLNHMEKTKLLILDDFGLQPLKADIRIALLQILEDRYEKHSIMIASQLPIGKWYDYLEDHTLADAILDRMTARAHKIELKGKSMRKKQ